MLPAMEHEGSRVLGTDADVLAEPIVLQDMDYIAARAVPGSEWSPEHKAMILRAPSARAAMVALTLKPTLANDWPELVELRDSLIQDVHPTDYATRLQIHVDAPLVHQSLLDEGHDWLEFDHEVNEAVPMKGPDGYWQAWPSQDTDLGYAAAIIEKHGSFELGWSRGYGKTLGTAAIAEANHYKSVLVAAPNTAKLDTWARELQHRLPSHKVVVLGNTPARRASALAQAQRYDAKGTPFFLVVHHEALAIIAGTKLRASGKGKQVLNGWNKLGIKWDLFAFDESQKLKNSGREGSQVHRATIKVPAEHRLALTGSVFENSWEELYGTLHWLYPARYHTKGEDWTMRFFDYVEAYARVYVGILPGREQALRDELGVFMVIREKTSHAIESTLKVQLSAPQQKAYDDLAEMLLTQLEDGTLVGADAGVVQLTRLRQVATGLGLLTDRLDDSSKIDAAVELIESSEDDFFVAAWYKPSAYGLAERLHERGQHNIFVITGNTPMKVRATLIAEAREAAERGERVVLIGTIATTGESLNLQFLNHVVRLDRSFNPALNRQVVDRVDRNGQRREVRLTDIVAEGTVDELVVMPNLSNKNAARAMLLGRGA